jgi:hypothetical protein
LAIVQYDPVTEPRSSKKRPAPEQLAPQGISSKAFREVKVHDDDGTVRATIMTFGSRVRRRTAFTEDQRKRTADARKAGVCSRCKRSKRQVRPFSLVPRARLDADPAPQCDIAQQESFYVSCSLCANTKIYKNAPRHPCFKAVLEHVLLFRSGKCRRGFLSPLSRPDLHD